MKSRLISERYLSVTELRGNCVLSVLKGVDGYLDAVFSRDIASLNVTYA